MTRTLVYVYYGNNGASGVSNGDGTFLFYDNFDGSALNTSKWSSGDSVSVSSSKVVLDSAGEYIQTRGTYDTNTGVSMQVTENPSI